MTRDFIFLCPLRSEPFHGSCPTPAHITLQTYPSGLHKTAFLGEQTPYLFANPRAPLTAPCAPLWLCKFKESGSDEQEYNASYFLFFFFFFFHLPDLYKSWNNQLNLKNNFGPGRGKSTLAAGGFSRRCGCAGRHDGAPTFHWPFHPGVCLQPWFLLV